MRSSRKLANGDPKMAAPNELPMVRKNVTPDVATAEVGESRRVLHDQDEHLHAHADPGAEDEEVQRLHDHRCLGIHLGQQHEPHRHHARANDREDLVPAGAAHYDATGLGGQQ